MALKLNITGKEYKKFYGRNIKKMPKLIAEGRVPLSVSGFKKKTLDVRNVYDNVGASWMENYFDTGDAIIYHPEGDILIHLDSENLRNINSKSPVNCGALLLSRDRDEAFSIYEELKKQSNVFEFKKGKLGKINEWLTKKEEKEQPILRVLARDQNLLNEYANYARERFGYDTALRIFHNPFSSNIELKALGIDEVNFGSSICGVDSLDEKSGLLVGVTSEGLNKLEKNNLSRISKPQRHSKSFF